MRIVENRNGLTRCPKCGAALDYGDNEVEGDNFWYKCWCSDDDCTWCGEEVYTLNFSNYYENEDQNQEVNNARTTSGTDSSTQWDGKNNS